ncbi:MAG: BatD family protein [Bacteroidales bacterium]
MLKNILFFALWVVLGSNAILAQEVSFIASAPEQVAVGETFQVSFALNTRPEEFSAPDFKGFRTVAGPSQYSSSSTQIINGKVTRTTSFSYAYTLMASEEGTFEIEPARAVVDGQSYQSNVLEVTVSGQASPGTGSPSAGSRVVDQDTPQRATEEDLFIRANISNRNPYQGEQVIISYKIYTRIPVSRYSERLPSFQGFWTETLGDGDPGTTTTEVIDGISYRVAEIRRIAVFAQRTGEITIEPLEVEAQVRVPSPRQRQSLFDEFFGGSPFDAYQNVQQTIRSNSVTLQVRALPSKSRPADFQGMVGQLDISATLEPRQLNVNDAANLAITISGRGNLRMLEQPQVPFPQNVEVFEPTVTDNIRNAASGISGSRKFEYTMIPRTPGTFEIPPMRIAYFDPSTQRYETRETEAFQIEVTGSVSGTEGADGGTSREQVQALSSDIRFIHTGPLTLIPVNSMFYGSKWFYLLVVLPVIVFVAFLVLWRRQIRLRSNQSMVRNRKAEKTARKRLKTARAFLKNKDKDAFYDEISKSLWGYISDKLNIPVAQLNREYVSGTFKEKNVSGHLAEKFLQAIDECEYARFAPGSSPAMMDEVYEKTLVTIIDLEKELNKR